MPFWKKDFATDGPKLVDETEARFKEVSGLAVYGTQCARGGQKVEAERCLTKMMKIRDEQAALSVPQTSIYYDYQDCRYRMMQNYASQLYFAINPNFRLSRRFADEFQKLCDEMEQCTKDLAVRIEGQETMDEGRRG